MGSIIVGMLLLFVVSLIIAKMIKDKKKGKSSCGCDGNCSHCGGCH